MTITQTVIIPADRLITLEIPPQIPEGKARVEFKVTPFVKENTSALQEKAGATPHTDALLSLLAGIGEVNINEIRDERLAKHLQ